MESPLKYLVVLFLLCAATSCSATFGVELGKALFAEIQGEK